MINTRLFVENVKNIRDETIIKLFSYQKVDPRTESKKFLAYRKAEFDGVKYMKPIIYSYMLSTCTGAALKKYPLMVDAEKLVAYDLKLRQQAIPKIKAIVDVLGLPMTTKDICKLICRQGTECYQDVRPSTLCNQNICNKCKSM